LIGPRVLKKQLLEIFKGEFENISGLTFSKIFNKRAAMKYASKKETRLKGPLIVKPKVGAFDSETSINTKIPHYQIYLEFDKLISNSSVYQGLDKLLYSRNNIVTKKTLQ